MIYQKLAMRTTKQNVKTNQKKSQNPNNSHQRKPTRLFKIMQSQTRKFPKSFNPFFQKRFRRFNKSMREAVLKWRELPRPDNSPNNLRISQRLFQKLKLKELSKFSPNKLNQNKLSKR